jgi:hypothetical protein
MWHRAGQHNPSGYTIDKRTCAVSKSVPIVAADLLSYTVYRELSHYLVFSVYVWAPRVKWVKSVNSPFDCLYTEMLIRFIRLFQWQSFVLGEKENLEQDSTILKGYKVRDTRSHRKVTKLYIYRKAHHIMASLDRLRLQYSENVVDSLQQPVIHMQTQGKNPDRYVSCQPLLLWIHRFSCLLIFWAK